MALYAPDPLRSRPIRLRWAGWESDTFRLQQHGWDLSAEDDIYERTLRVAMRNSEWRIRGMTEFWRPEMYPPGFSESVKHLNARLASDFVMPLYESGLGAFVAIDATPQWRGPGEPRSFDDFAHFAPARGREIILPEESVPKLLERILELQQPARTERIRRDRREERDSPPVHKVHAQIISLAA